MVEVEKTEGGWILEITDMAHGCLRQGGICGRRILVKTSTLSAYGICYSDDPHVYMSCYDYLTPVDLIIGQGVCDLELNKGEVIS